MATTTRRQNMRAENCRACGAQVEAQAGFLYRDTKPNRHTGRFGWFVKCAACHDGGESRNTVKMAREAAKRAAAEGAMGGEFAVAELRAAEVKVVELPRQYVGITDPHVVWVLRGKEWMVAFDYGGEPYGMMLLADRFARTHTTPGFASAAAKRYATERANAAREAYERRREGE